MIVGWNTALLFARIIIERLNLITMLSPGAVFLVLLASWPLAFADVKITSPAAGATIPGGTAVTITWADSGVAPAITDLAGYTILLYSGSNAAPVSLLALTSGTFAATPNSASVTIPVTIGGATANAYFLGVESTAKTGGTVVNYSSRFTLSGMTGKFDPAVTTALAAVSGTAGPATKTSGLVGAVVPGAAAPAAGDQWAIPYPEQVGNTKYAPMQPIPGKTITATNTKPLWPTSAIQYATTFLPVPTIVTTLTQAQTHPPSPHTNTVAAQAQPIDAMQRFLRRWKD